MEPLSPLPASELSRICDPDQLPSKTTDDLDDLQDFLGQARALNAVRFGISIRRDGKVLKPERYDQLSEAERSEIQGKIERLRKMFQLRQQSMLPLSAIGNTENS